ncbi:hypothetical protein [Haloplanus rubicundus]|uniref:Uncharacterized protein n=1 Tax=Haloplanus rubicundus TaxID=1547898 RepID=A0A345E8F0_9EURY|nr:hypothetical protein [Haloplanus rubicundus]AXG08472.1 hypothetical protein DU484_00660 [Haloplanus rubicundus]
MPRPSIDESLAEEIRRIHRETQQEAAGSFQEALDTVVQLALQQTELEERTSEDSTGWYPGKYAGRVVSKLVDGAGDDQSTSSVSGASGGEADPSLLPTRSPEEMAIFKTRLEDGHTVTFPEAEAVALGIEEGDILQVYAYGLDVRMDEDK